VSAWSSPHVARFKKQSIFDLKGRGFNAAVALGGEDNQLGGSLPRTALLDVFGSLRMKARTSASVASVVPSFNTIVRVSFADQPFDPVLIPVAKSVGECCHHSITSSARASTVAGISRPRAFAVLRLTTSSYLVGACTGKSAGFSPLRMRST